MHTGRLLPSLAGAVFLSLTGAALAQGHGTPNAPEAGPASPGAESRTGERSASPGGGDKGGPQTDAPPPNSTGTDAERKGREPKR